MLIDVGDLKPGDVFYTFDADIERYALLLWTLPCEVRIDFGGGINVPGRELGYLTGGVMKVKSFKTSKETTVRWPVRQT